MVASESCAFDIIGAQMIREVQPGEMVSSTAKGLEPEPVITGEAAHCVFDTSTSPGPTTPREPGAAGGPRPDGELLAEEALVDADLVISAPDSGNPMATGSRGRWDCRRTTA